MSITVHEMLTLNSFGNFRLIAGINGLDRRITRGGFIDHESPEDLSTSVVEGEMIFSNFALSKDRPEELVDYLSALIEAGSACLAIKTVVFKEIPEDVIRLANEKKYPIFQFDDTYIETLILEIEEALDHRKQLMKKAELIDELVSGSLNRFTVRNLARKINRRFKNSAIALYAEETGESLIRFDTKAARSILGKHCLVLPYHGGILMILTHGAGEVIDLASVLTSIGLGGGSHFIGISDPIHDLGALDQIVRQSETALLYARFKGQGKAHYSQLGIFQLLLPMLSDPLASDYYHRITEKLGVYDREHGTDLLETARVFIRLGGNIRETAEALFQHQNTIRYRVKKIYTLLFSDDEQYLRYETLATAVHLYELQRKL
jgi:hypothetical protein